MHSKTLKRFVAWDGAPDPFFVFVGHFELLRTLWDTFFENTKILEDKNTEDVSAIPLTIFWPVSFFVDHPITMFPLCL